MRTSAEARIRNRQKRTRCRAAEKKVLSLTDKASAQAELTKVFALLDHMASKGLFHRNTTARVKAKLSRYVGSLQG